jgi:hypothetical protein
VELPGSTFAAIVSQAATDAGIRQPFEFLYKQGIIPLQELASGR